MAKYIVDVDFTMSKSFSVEAADEEHAMQIMREKLYNNPYDFAHNFSHCVGTKVIDANLEK